MSERQLFRGLLARLEHLDLTEYGCFISRQLVHDTLEIVIPKVASKEVFDELSLRELAAIDYCRNVLLGHGKYLSSCKDGYRILLPSENAKQIDLYMRSAEKKLNRAGKLSRNSPHHVHQSDNTIARIEMKMQSTRTLPGSIRHRQTSNHAQT